MRTAPEYARLLRQFAELVYGESLARIMRESADELERLHAADAIRRACETDEAMTGDPVVLWSRPGGGE